MKNQISRRSALKFAAAGLAATTMGCSSGVTTAQKNKTSLLDKKVTDPWSQTHDRVWLGGEYWANPMEDWQVANGAVECLSTGGNRSVHSLLHQLTELKPFTLSVRLKRVKLGSQDGGAAIRVGVKSDIDEYRSNCFVQQGFDAGQHRS